jgi:hypothetical protein
LTIVPSGCGGKLWASSLPSGATMRLRPPRRWKLIGIRTISVPPSFRVGVRRSGSTDTITGADLSLRKDGVNA